MGSDQKHVGSSETSSDDQEETSHNSMRPTSDGSKDGLGRSYECTFCKRGFTNAQALGGHMNIHRKDKAKAKKHHDLASSAKQLPNKDHSIVSASGSFNLIPNEADAHQYYLGSSFGFQNTAVDHHQLVAPNPNFHWSSLAAASQMDINNNHALIQEEDLRVNLNLRIGTSSSEIGNSNILGFTNKIGQDWYHDQNDVDLELRLGHYP